MPTHEGDDVVLAMQYLDEYSGAIGNGLSAADIEEARICIGNALPDKKYSDTSEQPYAYIMLETPGWAQKIGDLADKWVKVWQDPAGIRRLC